MNWRTIFELSPHFKNNFKNRVPLKIFVKINFWNATSANSRLAVSLVMYVLKFPGWQHRRRNIIFFDFLANSGIDNPWVQRHPKKKLVIIYELLIILFLVQGNSDLDKAGVQTLVIIFFFFLGKAEEFSTLWLKVFFYLCLSELQPCQDRISNMWFFFSIFFWQAWVLKFVINFFFFFLV